VARTLSAKRCRAERHLKNNRTIRVVHSGFLIRPIIVGLFLTRACNPFPVIPNANRGRASKVCPDRSDLSLKWKQSEPGEGQGGEGIVSRGVSSPSLMES
jgi:hypothetical protein